MKRNYYEFLFFDPALTDSKHPTEGSLDGYSPILPCLHIVAYVVKLLTRE